MLRKRQPRREGWACLAAALAVLAASAIAPSGASALPELLYCMESSTGKYETMAKCEGLDETGTGALKWEWEAFLTGSGEEVLISFTGGVGSLNTLKHHIECKSGSGSGSVKGANELSAVTITFKECLDTTINSACNSTEPPGGSGEILTRELTAEMVYLKATKQTPGGILLLPVAQPFTRISCVGGLIKESVTGEVIGEIAATSINTPITTGELIYEENGASAQLWRKIEETFALHELTAFGEKAYEVGKETFELLVGVGGVTKKSELVF